MSSVIINKVNSDVVEIEVIETRTDQSVTTLQHALLDGQKEYNFAVVQLSCPLDNHPMFPITEEFELFRIARRNTNVSLTAAQPAYTIALNNLNTFVNVQSQQEADGGLSDALMYQLANAAPPNGLGLALGGFNRDIYIAAILAHYQAVYNAAIRQTTVNLLGRNGSYYISPGKPFYNPTTFVQDLNSWGNVFNVEQTIVGLQPNDYGGADTLVALVDDFVEQDGTVTDQIAEMRNADEAPTRFLKFMITADGSLEISAPSLFFNNFVIVMSNYGSALLGLNKSQFVTIGGLNYIQRTGDNSTTTFVNPANNDVKKKS